MDMLLTFLKEYAPDFSAREINFAVKQAIAGYINVAKEDMEHYQEFTAKYLQPILSSYRVVRGKLMSKYTDACLEFELMEAKKLERSGNQEEINTKLLEGAFENFKLGLNWLGSDRVFDILWQGKAIPFDKTKMQEFEELTMAEFKRLEKRGDKNACLIMEGMRLNIPVEKITDQNKPSFQEKMAIYSHNEIVKATKNKAVTNLFSRLVKEDKSILTHYQEHTEMIKNYMTDNQENKKV